MKTSDFNFDLPPDRIAAHPASPRDSARLLQVTDTFADYHVRDLPDLLRSNDVIIFNTTKVIPARLYGHRGLARIDVTLHQRLSDNIWHSFARPAKRLKIDDTIVFSPDFSARVKAKNGGEITLEFSCPGRTLTEALEVYGQMPLPPYISRPEGVEQQDKQDYQTIFAAHEGAVAAPTAGLHFTPDLLDRLRLKGISFAPVTLHVGAGTFMPVKTEFIKDHVMHSEYGEVPESTAQLVNAARREGRRIVAIGTTSLRILESAADPTGRVAPYARDTHIFITPGYRFRCVDALVTNFHLPQSTLFMLVCAFSGTDRMKAAYHHAIQNQYRFYSYGDACLLEKPGPIA